MKSTPSDQYGRKNKYILIHCLHRLVYAMQSFISVFYFKNVILWNFPRSIHKLIISGYKAHDSYVFISKTIFESGAPPRNQNHPEFSLANIYPSRTSKAPLRRREAFVVNIYSGLGSVCPVSHSFLRGDKLVERTPPIPFPTPSRSIFHQLAFHHKHISIRV